MNQNQNTQDNEAMALAVIILVVIAYFCLKPKKSKPGFHHDQVVHSEHHKPESHHAGHHQPVNNTQPQYRYDHERRDHTHRNHDDVQEIINMWERGYKAKDISRLTGYSMREVFGLLEYHGLLEPPEPEFKPIRRQEKNNHQRIIDY